jgi:hypothetical protein
MGTRLGIIGTSTNPNAAPHLHLEVRSFGTSSIGQGVFVQDTNGANNDYGILANGGDQAFNIYDPAQFFGEDVSAFRSDSSGFGDIVDVTGLGVTITNGASITFSTTNPCSLVLQYSIDTSRTEPDASGSPPDYEGFILSQSLTNPADPSFTPAP